ncbi:hypothetical protein V1264_016727 [Littorina saxatilis]|uniref:Uncharacterized protein n=2 Tax=Littorina saxatilis TaxID=31220 RepID=A0AAN9BHJ1_9CAEN
MRCLFTSKNGKCISDDKTSCLCPEENRPQLYRYVLQGDPSVSGTYTWTFPSQPCERSLNIRFIKLPNTSTGSLQSTASITVVPKSIGQGKATALVAVGVFLVTIGIVVITLTVFCGVSRICPGRRQHLSIPQNIPLQELHQEREQPLPQPQRVLPEIPGQYQVPPRIPSALSQSRPLACGRNLRRHRSQESNHYEIINEDEDRNAEGVRSSVSAPDVRVTALPADYLHPIPSAQEAAEARARDPVCENCCRSEHSRARSSRR